VVVSDSVPVGSTFASVSTTAGTCTGTATVRCAIGDLAVNGTAIVTLTVNVTAAAGKEVKDTASISAAGYDSAASDTAVAETKVTP
jgi:hypothetical protein